MPVRGMEPNVLALNSARHVLQLFVAGPLTSSPPPPPPPRPLPSTHSSPQDPSANPSQTLPLSLRSSLSDPFVLEIAEKLEDSLSSYPPIQSLPLQRLRDSSSQSLLSRSWPSSKDEPFRFTDTSFLKNSSILPVPIPALPSFSLDSPSPNLISLVDCHFATSLSRLSSLPAGAFAGSFSTLPQGPIYDRLLATVASADEFQGRDLFWDLNGVGAPDIAVIYIPAGERVVDEPIHIRFCYSEGDEIGSQRLRLSNPRVLVVVENGAEVGIVEEHLGVGGGEGRCYWANSVMEIVIEEGAKVTQSYVQRQSVNAAHIKSTFAQR